MPFSAYANVNHVLDRLVKGVTGILGEKLIGVYLYGSLVSGGFDPEISDLDLVVVMTEALDDERFCGLHNLHQEVVLDRPEWEDRLELAYVSRSALNTFRYKTSSIGIISPGEPFHIIDAGGDWVISWYMLRETGVPLSGPRIHSLINPIEETEYLQGVKEHIEAYRGAVNTVVSKSMLSYIVLTTVRGLYTLTMSKPTSKNQAAQWAASEFPAWADLINRALRWRENPDADTLNVAAIRPQAQALVIDLLDKIPN